MGAVSRQPWSTRGLDAASCASNVFLGDGWRADLAGQSGLRPPCPIAPHTMVHPSDRFPAKRDLVRRQKARQDSDLEPYAIARDRRRDWIRL